MVPPAPGVLDDDRLAERLGHRLADQARDGVRGAAGREGHDDGDGAVGVVLRRRAASASEQRQPASSFFNISILLVGFSWPAVKTPVRRGVDRPAIIIDARESPRTPARAPRAIRLPPEGPQPAAGLLRAAVPVRREAPRRRRPQLRHPRVAGAGRRGAGARGAALRARRGDPSGRALDARYRCCSTRRCASSPRRAHLAAIEAALRAGDARGAANRLAEWQGETAGVDDAAAVARLAAEQRCAKRTTALSRSSSGSCCCRARSGSCSIRSRTARRARGSRASSPASATSAGSPRAPST